MKCAVAVSGGIDSLYTTLLLKEKGEDVIGIFGIFTPYLNRIKNRIIDSFKQIGIRCIAVDLIEEFEEYVVAPFIREYLNGLTPNPCCICNKYIKFNLLKKKINELGFELFATGHYANLVKQDKRIELHKGIDKQKDQSYFLSLVSIDDFNGVEMPIGNFKKQEIKIKISNRGITPPINSESQEICFVKTDYRDFLKTRGIDLPGPGPIMGVWGERLGTHNGLFNYTIGQRRGLKIPYREALYVVDKDLEENTLIVGTISDLKTRECVVSGVNCLMGFESWPEEVMVKCNYNMRETQAKIELIGTRKVRLIFDEPVNRPTPGQICCFYSEPRVLGGGIISGE